jgi:hypothetical protein
VGKVAGTDKGVKLLTRSGNVYTFTPAIKVTMAFPDGADAKEDNCQELVRMLVVYNQ